MLTKFVSLIESSIVELRSQEDLAVSILALIKRFRIDVLSTFSDRVIQKEYEGLYNRTQFAILGDLEAKKGKNNRKKIKIYINFCLKIKLKRSILKIIKKSK